MIRTLKSGAARKLCAKQRITEICKDECIDIQCIFSRRRDASFVAMRRKIALIMRDEGFSANIIAHTMGLDHSTVGNYFHEKK